jgi:hypothetical protein
MTAASFRFANPMTATRIHFSDSRLAADAMELGTTFFSRNSGLSRDMAYVE